MSEHHHEHQHSHEHRGHHHAGDALGEANRKQYDEGARAADYAASVMAKTMAEAMAQSIKRNFSFDADETTMLDFACGPGQVSQALAPLLKKAVGLDISQGMVDVFNSEAERLGLGSKLSAVRSDDPFEAVNQVCPTETDLFDLVICCQAFHHFSDPGAMAQKLQKFLKPGVGSLVIIDFDEKEGFIAKIIKHLGHEAFGEHKHHVSAPGFSIQGLEDMFNKGEGWKDVEAKVSHTVNMRQLHSLGGRMNMLVDKFGAECPDDDVLYLIAKATRA